MKVIKKENDRDVIYVQKCDLRFLNMCDEIMPATIYMKAFGQGCTKIDERNELDYIRFDKPEEVNYFMNLQFILDFNEYENLSLEELESKGKEMVDSINKIRKIFNSMSGEEQRSSVSLCKQHDKLGHLYNSIVLIYTQKHNGISIPLPTTSDQEKEIEGIAKKLPNIYDKK